MTIASLEIMQPGVAYMAVPRCDRCVAWRAFSGRNAFGFCSTLARNDGEATVSVIVVARENGRSHGDRIGTVATAASFGCVLFAERA